LPNGEGWKRRRCAGDSGRYVDGLPMISFKWHDTVQ
jgi:hypothetical protein